MKEKINLKDFVNKKELENVFDELFPIPRSITGDGFKKSLKILGKIVDLNIIKVKSGSKVLDWTVPNEWNIKSAYLFESKKKKIIDFKNNSLHIVSYSIPVNKLITFNELDKKIHTIKKLPNAIPYVTSYYYKTWGFCMTYNNYKKLDRKKKI